MPALYIELGQQIGILAPGRDPQSRGQSWLSERKEELYQLICVGAGYCAFIAKNRNAHTIEVIAAVGDLLSSIYSGLPVYNIAALLVRSSLDEFCKCEGNNH